MVRQTVEEVRAGRVSAVDRVGVALARVDELNPSLNAVVHVPVDEALAMAARVDAQVAAGQDPGPLAGLVCSVKANIDVRGWATTHGCARFARMIAEADAPLVARARAAGAVVLGHANMPTLTMRGAHTCSELYGETRNPWNPRLSPGGSSGGDAVAVAAGMVDFGIGNDSGGSLRLPATLTGICGLKPSYGLLPQDHRLGGADPTLAAQVIPVDGPMARTVDDLRLLLRVMAGPDPVDPRVTAVPDAARTERCRVGVVRQPLPSSVQSAVVKAVEAAADALSAAGYDVVETDLPCAREALECYSGLIMTEFAQTWPRVKPLLGEEGSRYIEHSLRQCPPRDLPGYLELTARRLSLQRIWAELFADTPLVLGATFGWDRLWPDEEWSSYERHVEFAAAMTLSRISSVLGHAAVAVPAAIEQGLPQGVQLLGPARSEEQCLAAAQVIEQALGAVITLGLAGRTHASRHQGAVQRGARTL